MPRHRAPDRRARAPRATERLAAGLCVLCGARPHTEDTTRCELCREEQRDRQARAVAARRRKHLCVRCGTPAVQGRTLCQPHLDAAAAYQRSYSEPAHG